MDITERFTDLDKKLDEIRSESFKAPAKQGDRIAVIVRTPMTRTYEHFGIQYWTREMIEKGQSQNTDKLISYFCEVLHKTNPPK